MKNKKLYFYFSDTEYADLLSKHIVLSDYENKTIKKLPDDLASEDMLLIDAHIGNYKQGFEGLAIYNQLNNKNALKKIFVFSWYSIEQLTESGIYFKGKNTIQLFNPKYPNFVYFTFPVKPDTVLDQLNKQL